MNNYVQIIKIALIVFPFVALLMSIPFILLQYHKYGSISFFKGLITYSFTLYFICAYFLVILPLPKISVVAAMTTARMQLIPFSFIIDFIKHTSLEITNIHTYITALKESYFYVPIYNIFLTMPFGIYLRYYFKCNLKKVILYTFLLSLFFELTQLSGLYFLYPRGYRLFDVDDLLLNTLGGIIGYLIAKPIIKILPKIEKIEGDAKKRGKIISGLRRTNAFFLDLFIFLFFETLVASFIKSKLVFVLIIIIYYFIIPVLLKNSTLGQKFLNMQILDYNEKINPYRLILRNLFFIIIYIGIPLGTSLFINNININDAIKEFVGLILILIIFFIYIITSIKYLFTNKEMLYERLSKTKIISTIK